MNKMETKLNNNEMKNVKCNDEASLAGLPLLARAMEHAAELKAMADEQPPRDTDGNAGWAIGRR